MLPASHLAAGNRTQPPGLDGLRLQPLPRGHSDEKVQQECGHISALPGADHHSLLEWDGGFAGTRGHLTQTPAQGGGAMGG